MAAEKELFTDIQLDVPWRRQRDSYSCGTISVQMVTRYWGIHASLPEIRRRAGLDPQSERRGTDEFAILRAFHSYGLKTREIKRGTLVTLQNAFFLGIPPLIYFRQRDHWFVAVGFGEGRVLIKDPNPVKRGMKPMGEELWGYTFHTFQKGWGGYAILTMNPAPELPFP